VRTSGAEIIRDGDTGFLVSPDDPRHLAQRLDALVGDPARRVSMGSRARAWCGRTYRWSTCARGYLDTLQAGL
jgi:glycosyltransferase involved in cell wall biosynthesis